MHRIKKYLIVSAMAVILALGTWLAVDQTLIRIRTRRAEVEFEARRLATWEKFVNTPIDFTNTVSTCPLHGDPLKQEIVPIVQPPQDLCGVIFAAQEKAFPFANDPYLNLSICQWDMKYAHVSFCPSCRSAQAEWAKTNEDPRIDFVAWKEDALHNNRKDDTGE